jgi:hypothetical protein
MRTQKPPQTKKMITSQPNAAKPWKPRRHRGLAKNDPGEARANEIRLLHEAIGRFPSSVGDQQSFWSQATGKSRASFFRLLARHRSR